MIGKNFLSNLKYVLSNALLLLVPSFIFIVVKVNTKDNTIDWSFENIFYYFILYTVLLSLFVFKPHLMISNSQKYKTLQRKAHNSISQLYSHPWVPLVLYSGLAIMFFMYPLVFSLYQIKVFILVFIYLIFAFGLNYSVGFAGFLNLGHVLPFAAGAYAYGLVYKYFVLGFFPGLIAGLIVGGLVGLCIAIITIRLNGDYLAIVTLALAEIFKIVMNNIDTITNGARGISGIPLPEIFGMDLNLKSKYTLLYYIAGAIALLSIFVAKRLVKSRFGRSWEAIREDSIAAESSGINLKKVRLTVFLIGGCYAGLAGVIHAANATYINPNTSAILYSITVLSIVVLGGLGSIRGVILGTIIVILLPEYLRSFSEYRMLMYGALLIIMMRYRQRGLLPQKRERYDIYMKEEKPDA